MSKRYVNFLVVPEGSPRSLKFRLSYFTSGLLLSLVCLLLILAIVFSVFHGRLLYRVAAAKSLKQENERLKKYNAEVVELEKEVKEYRAFVQRVANLAGIKYEGKVMAPLLSNPAKTESLTKEVVGQVGANKEGRMASVETAGGKPDSLTDMSTGPPIEGWTTQGFSRNMSDFGIGHPGVDIAAKVGTKVRATADGKVSLVTWDDIYGSLVAIDHGNGYVSYYGHNSKILVNIGDTVRRGDVIALSGNSGRSSAPHLHYEIRKDGIAIDPKDFLKPSSH
jgi:murein DD-endopeptidase MepM/ murein hydrolase activator NlpD